MLPEEVARPGQERERRERGAGGKGAGKQFTRNSPRRVRRLDTLLFVPTAICRLQPFSRHRSLHHRHLSARGRPLQPRSTPSSVSVNEGGIQHRPLSLAAMRKSAKPRSPTGILNTDDSSVLFLQQPPPTPSPSCSAAPAAPPGLLHRRDPFVLPLNPPPDRN